MTPSPGSECGMFVCLCLKDQHWPTKTNISKVWQKKDELLASVMWLWKVLPLPAENWEPLFLAGCSKRPTLISCHTVFFPGQLSPWQAKARRILCVPYFWNCYPTYLSHLSQVEYSCLKFLGPEVFPILDFHQILKCFYKYLGEKPGKFPLHYYSTHKHRLRVTV